MRQRGLRQQRDRLGELWQSGNLGQSFHSGDGLGGDGHGAHGFFVPFVSDVDDSISLAGSCTHFVVHFGDQRTHRIHHVATSIAGGGDDRGCRTVRGQHDGSTNGHFADVIHEHHTALDETIHHDAIVDDFVVAVHRCIEGANHPCQCLDCHFHSRAKSAWSSK